MKAASATLLILLYSMPLPAGRKPAYIPFTTNPDGLVLIHATAGGIPIQAIFDTGAGLDVLAPSLVEKLHGRPSGQFSGFRMTGERLDISLFVIPELSIGSMTKKDALVGTWDLLDKYHLDGILSVGDFRQQPFTLDFAHKVMVFETAESIVQRRTEGKESPLQFDDQRGISLSLFATFLIANKSGQCEIDTGSPSATVGMRYMAALGIDKDADDVHKHEGQTIAGAPELRYDTTLPQLSLSSAPEIRLVRPRASFSNIIYDCVVGVDFWRDGALTIDVANRQLIVSDRPAQATVASDPIQLTLNTDEAEAVLAILDKRALGATVAESDWQRLFATEPYIRLKKREASLHRDFTDDDFKKLVLSLELMAKRSALRQTLNAWKQTDLVASAHHDLTYLPEQAVIKAKVFPVIKPKTNSFVFETQTDPAIFLYLDPEESAASFENTVAHELHHIGYASVESLAEGRQKDVPANAKPAVEWMGAFGEGFAMLAAAGGPDVDPQATSSLKDQARWNHDMANFNSDLVSLQQFFLDVINQKLVGKDKIDEKAYTFFGTQGPWYTVGYKIAVIVEKRFGRKTLIDCMLDPRQLLVYYNQAAKETNQHEPDKLALWSNDLLQKIGERSADSKLQ